MLKVILLFIAIGHVLAQPARDAPQFANQRSLAQKYQEAARAVAAVLVAEKEVPSEFAAFVKEQEDGRYFVFSLWHQNLFRRPDGIRNPGGKSRDITYDAKLKKAFPSVMWPEK